MTLILDKLAFAKRLGRTGQSIEVTDAVTIALYDLPRNLAAAGPGGATIKGITALRKLVRAGPRYAA